MLPPPPTLPADCVALSLALAPAAREGVTLGVVMSPPLLLAIAVRGGVGVRVIKVGMVEALYAGVSVASGEKVDAAVS